MALSRDDYIALIRKLEAFSHQHPAAYRRRLVLLALFGYLFIFLMLLIVLLLLTGVFIFMFAARQLMVEACYVIFFLILVAGVIIRSLRVRIYEPEGILLSRSDVPELFQAIDDLSRAFVTPAIDEVLLIDDFQMAIRQIPRWGLYGPSYSYLLLGFPMMHALSPEQFYAVLAHELAHLSAQHGRISNWIYRQREVWQLLLAGLQGSPHGAIINGFLKWYAPYFIAYSSVQARAREYQADCLGGEVAGPRHLASALIAIHTRDQLLDTFFQESLTRQMQETRRPPQDLYSQLAGVAAQPVPVEEANNRASRAILRRTDYSDTHPALRDRLTALGVNDMLTDPHVLGQLLCCPVEPTAANVFLGAYLPRLTDRLNRRWVEAVARHWEQSHASARHHLARLDELNERVGRGEPLNPDAGWERVQLTAELHGSVTAIPLLRDYLATRPDFIPAQFELGRALLVVEEDDAGIAMIEHAMDGDPAFILRGCEVITGYLKARGRNDEAEAYIRRGLAYAPS